MSDNKIDTTEMIRSARDNAHRGLSMNVWIAEALAPRIDALNAEVDRLTERLSNAIEVDWSKAPGSSKGVSVRWTQLDSGEWFRGEQGGIGYIPRPAPVKREKTAQELWQDLRKRSSPLLTGDKLKDLCRAAGIPLETEA